MFICDAHNCGLIVPKVWGKSFNGEKILWHCDLHRVEGCQWYKEGDTEKPKKIKRFVSLRIKKGKRTDTRKKHASICNDFLDGLTFQEMEDKYEMNRETIRGIIKAKLGRKLYNELSTNRVDKSINNATI